MVDADEAPDGVGVAGNRHGLQKDVPQITRGLDEAVNSLEFTPVLDAVAGDSKHRGEVIGVYALHPAVAQGFGDTQPGKPLPGSVEVGAMPLDVRLKNADGKVFNQKLKEKIRLRKGLGGFRGRLHPSG